MKRTTKAFIILSILAVALIVTGCNLFNSVKEAVEQTYNTWYIYSGDKTISIPLGSDADAEDDSSSTKSLENVELYVYYDNEDGLTVAVQAKTEQNVELLGGLASKKTTVYTGGTKKYTKEQFSPLKWTALMTNISFEEDDEPKVSKHPDECIILAGDDAGDLKIQWKKVLARIMFKQFLGEDL